MRPFFMGLVCLIITLFNYKSLFSTDLPDCLYAYQNIPVGTKTSDTTASVSITQYSIQQNILPAFKSIINGQVVSNATSILVGKKNYLLFNVVLNSDTLIVAVELIDQNGNLLFNPSKKLGIHISYNIGACTECIFIRNSLDKIIGCSCKEVPASGDWSCKHSFEQSKSN